MSGKTAPRSVQHGVPAGMLRKPTLRDPSGARLRAVVKWTPKFGQLGKVVGTSEGRTHDDEAREAVALHGNRGLSGFRSFPGSHYADCPAILVFKAWTEKQGAYCTEIRD
jgi:hypothetical protein